jgi:glycosyltransferase involved in cell wall biosynthesis
MRPLVSVIIPCYNQGEFLSFAFRSLQEQSLTQWECIVVDDGSTDNTAEVAESFIQADKRIRLIQQPNSGSAVARNKGLAEAKGEYIQFLDADDMLNHDKLHLQSEYMTTNNIDVSYTRNAYFHSMKELGKYTLQPKKQFRYYTNIRNALFYVPASIPGGARDKI